MDNVLYFNAHKVSRGHEFDMLCSYLGEKAWKDAPSFYSALEECIKGGTTLPDCIVIYLPSLKLNACEEYWKNKELNESFFNRLSKNNVKYTKAIFFVEMRKGEFVLNSKLSSGCELIEFNEEEIVALYSYGLGELVKNNDVINIAPAGHTFKHPSGRKNKLFIQSRELAKNETELQFISKGLSALTPKVNWTEVETVYIDTMGIYSIVKEALMFTNAKASIKSFHSYSSLKGLNLPAENYLIVISASTSGNMAMDLVSRGFSKEKIITLIDIKERESCSHVFIDLSSTELLSGMGIADGNETDIELIGEHFSYKVKPPKQITIGVPHRPKYLLDILKEFGLTGINKINQRVDVIGKSPLLSLKPDNLHNSKDFNNWLNSELSWSLASSISTVLYSDDGASKEIADKAFAFIKKLSNNDREISLLKWPDLTKDELKASTGILVISAFAGDGGRLRQISRDLREYENKVIPRHFLIGVGLPQRIESWERLKQFLERNATTRLYNFSAWKVLPLGPDNVQRSWKELTLLAAKSENESQSPLVDISHSDASSCYDALSKCIASCNNSLLPSTSGEQLRITEGFVFFNGYFDNKIDNVTQSDVLLAMASVLQAAREHPDSDKCLRPTNYQSVIISPENFLRFNDDILQACILRASLPSELDYSSDHHLSELMKEFLYKIFTRHQHSYGSASLEFAAALAVGKIKLKKEHYKELIEKSIKKVGMDSEVLTGLLLMAYRNE